MWWFAELRAAAARLDTRMAAARERRRRRRTGVPVNRDPCGTNGLGFLKERVVANLMHAIAKREVVGAGLAMAELERGGALAWRGGGGTGRVGPYPH